MRRLACLIVGTAFVFGSVLVAQTASKVCAIKVSGMTCSGCEVAVRLAAKSVPGVKDVKVSYKNSRADVMYDPNKTSPAAIAKVIADKTGYRAEVEDTKATR